MTVVHFRCCLTRVLLLTLVVMMTFAPERAEASPAAGRPRIGLVLSGGGARGIAHIGVLKVLEEMRIPVDVVTGTSMGAIVGGLYAAGLSPEELEALVTSVEWNEAFRDKPAPEEQSFRRKQDTQQYQIDFDLGFKNGQFTIPLGLVQGQNLNHILNMALIHKATVRDFDRLHIPFRAVAADIETGDAVVLGKGDLVTALRASMSIPGVFAPVEMEGKMLVDGGIANNLPINVAREMGAEVLICVDIGTPLRSRGKLQSAAGITAQVMTILIQRNVAAQLKTIQKHDILIQPDLGDAGTTDFARAPAILKVGEEKARTMQSQLARLSQPPETYLAYLRRHRHDLKVMPTLDEVRIVHHSGLADKVLAAQVETKAGEKIDEQHLQADLMRLYNLGTFERVDMNLEEKNGRTSLTLTPVTKSWGQTNIRFGFSFDDNFRGFSTYTISAIVNQMEMNSLGGEWRNEFQIGNMPRFQSEFYQPLDASTRFFVAPLLEYRESNVNIFNAQGDNVVQYRLKYLQGGVDVGRQFGNWGEVRLGVRRGYGAYRVNIGDPALDSGSFNRGGIYTALRYNTIDNFNFPRHGTDANLIWQFNLRQMGSDTSDSGLILTWNRAMTWGENTLVPGITVQTMINGDGRMEDSYSLGGFLNLSGYSAGELSGQHTGLGRLVYLRRIGRLGLGNFKLQTFLGGSAEAGQAWNRREDISFSTLTAAGSVFIGADSFLGPAYIGYGQAEGGRGTVYFSIGQKF
jgi:NTE family protein